MALQNQPLSVSFAQGINTKTDSKQVQGDYLLIKNAIYTTLERLDLRLGYAALTNSVTFLNGWILAPSTITSGNLLSSIENSLLLHDGTYSYTRSQDVATWAVVGQKTQATVSLDQVGGLTQIQQHNLSLAKASNGYELTTWQAGPISTGALPVYFTVYDPSTETVVNSGQLTSNYTSSKCCAVGSDFFIVATIASAVDIYKQPGATPFFETASPTSVGTGLSAGTNPNPDLAISATSIYILFDKVFRVIASSLAVTSTTAGRGSAPLGGIAYDTSADQVWVGWYNGSNTVVTVFNSSLTVLLGPTSTGASPPEGSAVCVGAANGVFRIMYNDSEWYRETVLIQVNYNTISPGAFTTKLQTLATNAQVASKLFMVGSDVYYYGVYTNPLTSVDSNEDELISPVQPTTFLLKIRPNQMPGTDYDFLTPLVVAKLLPLNTGTPYTVNYDGADPTVYTVLFTSPPEVVLDSVSGAYLYPNYLVTGTQAYVAPTIQEPPVYNLTTPVRCGVALSGRMRSQLLAQNQHSTAGFISSFDRSKEVELGYHLFPEFISCVLGGPTTVGWTTGTYSFVAVYAWTDALGQVQRSAPSTPITQTVAAPASPSALAVEVTPLYFTDKGQTNITIEIYGTLNAGTVYYYVGSIPNDFGGSSFGSGARATRQLYTTGGEVENISAPAATFIASFKNRMFAIPAETPNTLWYSKQVIPGTPVEFSNELTLSLDERGGDAMGLGVLDDKLIIFKRNAVFYLVGDGPSPSGTNNDFPFPQSIPASAGCTEPDSIVLSPTGLFYKGANGIYFLDRSMQVSYIGAPVEAYNQYTITSAVSDARTTQVRFTLSSGIALVYDYLVKKWCTFDNINATSACNWLGNYTYLTPTGQTNPETPGAYSDNGAVIRMGFRTSWLSLAKIQGFQRLKNLMFLGQCYSACTLYVGFYYDFEPAPLNVEQVTMAAAENPWQRRFFPKRQKCESMQLLVEVVPSDTTGAGLALSGIAMLAGIKKGLNKISAAKSTG